MISKGKSGEYVRFNQIFIQYSDCEPYILESPVNVIGYHLKFRHSGEYLSFATEKNPPSIFYGYQLNYATPIELAKHRIKHDNNRAIHS